MAFNFKPKKESEMSSGFEPMPKGEYPFTILHSEIVASKSEKNKGKPMIKVNLIIHTDNGDRRLYDYFADWFSEWKLKHILETTGFKDEYLSGQISPEGNGWADRAGFVSIGIETDKQTGEKKNKVNDYLPDDAQRCPEDGDPAPTSKPVASAPVEPTATDGDDVPF